MKTLVLGGTGTVGGLVVKELLQRGADVRVLSRSEERIAALPDGVGGVRGDLLEPATVRSVFSGIDAVFMANALGPSEMHEALMAVQGAREAGVRRFAYLSIHRLEEALHLPHFGAKLPVEKVLEESGMNCTILRAGNFFQNDYWYTDIMREHGVYPQPIGSVGLARVDARDIAAVAALALTGEREPAGKINLVGPDLLTGEQVAAAWAKALERTVQYAGDDLDAWEAQSLQFMPAWMVYDLRMMYAYMQTRGMPADAADIDRLTEYLGRPPTRFSAFTRATASRSISGQ